ncbi:MAG: GNAT family N-acetyltransferase [Polyangiaceae bacterium]
MSGPSDVRFEVVSVAHNAALDDLFARADVACHCRYWHFTGDKNAWLDRCFHAPADNAREFHEDLERSPELHGMVALSGERVVGWLKLSPAERVQKLYDQRLYRGLPCFQGDRAGTYSVGCVLVDPDWRRRGVAQGLLRAGVEHCRALGARQIEAFPRRGELLGDPEMWLGPFTIFERAGFDVVNDFGPYPVLRLALEA